METEFFATGGIGMRDGVPTEGTSVVIGFYGDSGCKEINTLFSENSGVVWDFASIQHYL
jgi:hypothetical protein